MEGKVTGNLLTGLRPDSLYSRETKSGADSYLTDALGSTIALANGVGEVETSYRYDPFGTAVSTGAEAQNPFQFTGRENDGDGLQYNRARYYSAATARFISQDPSGAAGSGPNLYQYVLGDPIDFVDPTGLELGNPGEGGPYPGQHLPNWGAMLPPGPSPFPPTPSPQLPPPEPPCPASPGLPGSSGLPSPTIGPDWGANLPGPPAPGPPNWGAVVNVLGAGAVGAVVGIPGGPLGVVSGFLYGVGTAAFVVLATESGHPFIGGFINDASNASTIARGVNFLAGCL